MDFGDAEPLSSGNKRLTTGQDLAVTVTVTVGADGVLICSSTLAARTSNGAHFIGSSPFEPWGPLLGPRPAALG